MSDWKSDLNDFFTKEDEEKNTKGQREATQLERTKEWLENVVGPALYDVQPDFQQRGRDVQVRITSRSASISVSHNGTLEIEARIIPRVSVALSFPATETVINNRSNGKRYRLQGWVRCGSPEHDIREVTKENIITWFVSEYRRHVRP